MPREQRAPDGGRRWAQTIAANVRHARRVRDLRQDDVAERMQMLGYPWSRATLSDVERANRDVTFDELAALAMIFGVPPLELLDPRGPLGDREDDELAFGEGSVRADYLASWLAGHHTVEMTIGDDGRPEWKIEPRTEEGAQAVWRKLEAIHQRRDDEEDDR